MNAWTEYTTATEKHNELIHLCHRIAQVAETARELGVEFEDLSELELEARVALSRHVNRGHVSVVLELKYNPEDYGLAPYPNPETVDIIRDMALADILDLKLSDISPALEIVGSSK